MVNRINIFLISILLSLSLVSSITWSGGGGFAGANVTSVTSGDSYVSASPNTGNVVVTLTSAATQWFKNIFNQDLNTTNNVQFNNINSTGIVYSIDTTGQIHYSSVEGTNANQLRASTVTNAVIANTSYIGATIYSVDGKNLSVNYNGTVFPKGTTNDSFAWNQGTNTTPVVNHVFYNSSGNLSIENVLNVGTPDVAFGIIGGNFAYASLVGTGTSNQFIENVYHRFFRAGVIYISGFNPSVSASNINFSVGSYTILVNEVTNTINQSSTRRFFYVRSNGNYVIANDISNISAYGDTGVDIGNNKYFNVVCGYSHVQNGNTNIVTGEMVCIPQNQPASEYTNEISAENDIYKSTILSPPGQYLKYFYTPVLRVVMQRSGGVNTIQTLSNGLFYFDISGSSGISAGSSGGGTAIFNIFNQDLNTTNSVTFGNLTIASTGNLTINGNTLVADGINNRVGIATASASTTLEVNGTTNITQSLFVNNINVSNFLKNIFDQHLNTTSNVLFANITSNGNLTIAGNGTIQSLYVGPGTKSGLALLEVNSVDTFPLRLGTSAAGQSNNWTIRLTSNSGGYGIATGSMFLYPVNGISDFCISNTSGSGACNFVIDNGDKTIDIPYYNLGVGLSGSNRPTATLDVNGSVLLRTDLNVTNNVRIGNLTILSGGNLTVNGNNFFVNGTGNGVGINAQTPRLATLQVSGLTASAGIPPAGNISNTSLYLTNSNTLYGMLFGSDSNGYGWIQQQRTDNAATTYDLILQPNGNNVGIGTLTPSQKLEVKGNFIET